jgi:hypothetical protein
VISPTGEAGRSTGWLAGNESIRGCFADMDHAGVRVGEAASHH